MSITLGTTDSVQTNTDTGHGLLIAKKALSQQELEGQLAVQLIQSAGAPQTTQSPVGNIGHNINIKA